MVASRKAITMTDLGQRIASLEATVSALEKYEHERWHKLANDLQPLVSLPEKMTREVGRMQGTFNGQIASMSKEIERSITAAVERAIEPIHVDMSAIRSRVSALENNQSQLTGAKGVMIWIVQTVIAAVAAIVAVFAYMHGDAR